MSKFTDIIEAVEENNRINDGSWRDWYDAQHISETYEVELAEHQIIFLNCLIRDNGENLSVYISADDCIKTGSEFAR